MRKLYAVSRKRLIELLNKEEYLDYLIRNGQAHSYGYEGLKNDPDQLDLFTPIPYNNKRYIIAVDDPTEEK